MSRRTEQVAGLLVQVVGEIIRNEISDPRISSLVTITGAKVSSDLHNAVIYFSVLGNEMEWESTGQALSNATGFIQRLVGQRIVLKVTPRLTFIADHTIEKAQHIESIIDNFAQSHKTQDVEKPDNESLNEPQ